MSVVEDLQAAATAVATRLGSATVAVGRDARGSGMILAEGKVLTNAHHLRDRTIQITFADGHAAQGEVRGIDRDGDLVVVAVDTAGREPIEWSTEGPATGAVVFGVARARHGLRVTFGMVSGVDREFRGPGGRRITGAVEHTATLARGSSGGPLADAAGRVLGINTHRLGDGFYLAQTADTSLRERLDQLAAGQSTVHPRLGIAVAPAALARRLRRSVGLPERDGLLVRGVDDDSPAARGGIRVGDLIVAAGGRDTPRTDDLWAVLDALAGTDDGTAAVDLVVVRGVDELTLRVSFETASGPGSTA